MQYFSRLLFNFDGKIARIDYWIAFILLQAISVCATLAIQPDYFTGDVTRPLPLAVFTVALMVPQYAVCAKRFRDLEWPVWLAFAIVADATAGSDLTDRRTRSGKANSSPPERPPSTSRQHRSPPESAVVKETFP